MSSPKLFLTTPNLTSNSRVKKWSYAIRASNSQGQEEEEEGEEESPSNSSSREDMAYLLKLGAGSVAGAAVIKFGSILYPEMTRPNLLQALIMISTPMVFFWLSGSSRMDGITGGGGTLKNGAEKTELLFIPSPGLGHLLPAAEIARLLVSRDDRLHITFLIMKLPFEAKFTGYTNSLIASTISYRIRFLDLPFQESAFNVNAEDIVNSYMETYKPHVREAVFKHIQRSESSPDSSSPRLAGFFMDMFTTTMMDVADEIGVPSYVMITSGGGLLSLMFHLQALHDEQGVDITEFKDSDTELVLPSSANPIPARVLPSAVLNKNSVSGFINFARRYRESKGIVVNTFFELESRALISLSSDIAPPVYPVGPILNVNRDSKDGTGEIIKWLDGQPPTSVVFLCFGSMGWFGEDQVREIAYALERSGHQFLWSLRRPPPPGTIAFPDDYMNHEEILPEGFLDRTAGVGKIIGWAPQVEILAHPAIGGFVSHCGWNSIMESLWYGVPIATWPTEGEQQFNAFEMVVELGLGVEIRLDHRREVLGRDEMMVSGEVIERAIRKLMESESEVRKRVKEMSEKGRKALMNGGSSYCTIGRLIEDVFNNVH